MAKRTIEIEVYQTPDGKPTCFESGRDGLVCIALGTKFALPAAYSHSFCRLTSDKLEYTTPGKDGEPNYLTPSKNCPVWKGGSA